ncbi:MAG: DUF4139 domain-containing protein [bacterium]
MKQQSKAGIIFSGFLFFFILLMGCYPEAGYSKGSAIQSTMENRTSLTLTIYNQNYGLVHEERTLSLSPAERQEILLMDVPAQIEPDTVFIETGKQEIKILEQKFEYDLITQESLLKQYVGKQLKIMEINPATGEKSVLEAELLSFNNNQPIYRIKGEIYLGYPHGVIILPQIPEQLAVRPTLRWLLHNASQKAQEKSVAVSYLSRGLNWTANYVLQLNQKGTSGDLSSWVAIENQSGTTFPEARIKLMAGEVKREEVVAYGVRRMKVAAEGLDTEAGQAPFAEESLAEYHLYTLDRPSTLKDQQTTRISFIEASRIPIQKEFVFQGQGVYQRSYQESFEVPKPVQVYLKLENKKEQHLGLPLPQGAIRVYQAGQNSAQAEFIGEDRLGHTPVEETMRVQIGKAFDVTGVQKQMEWQKISTQVYESSWQVTLRNQKDEKIVVRVIAPMQGEWKVLSSSHPYERLEAYKIGFAVTIPAKGEETVTYRVRIKF